MKPPRSDKNSPHNKLFVRFEESEVIQFGEESESDTLTIIFEPVKEDKPFSTSYPISQKIIFLDNELAVIVESN